MDHRHARQNMVENQLRPSQIDDPAVLAAMGEVPRERFVTPALAGVAYADEDLLLPDGASLIEPLTMARLLQHAAIGPQDAVLVVGCTTGYAASLCARIAARVVHLLPPGAATPALQALLAEQAGGKVVPAEAADPAAGVPEAAPFDAILVIGSVPAVPAPLLDQLAEGGRLVAVVGTGRIGHGTLCTRLHGVIGQRVLFDARIPPLPGLVLAPAFAF